MVQLRDLFDMDLFAQMIEEGYVTVRPHKKKDWAIANYTPAAQYGWVWNEVTVKCRGLVFCPHTLEVVARPFEKFFNWDQGKGMETWQNAMPPSGPVVRMEKMDGSLGVLCVEYDGDQPVYEWVATRGSFHSEQAEWATHTYLDLVTYQANNVPSELAFEPKFGKTYLFEIIYSENRIVVDYGDYEGLVLIDVIDNETGFADLQEFDDCMWPDKVERVVLNHGFDSGQAAEIPPGDEGFVYLWPNINFRTKMKSAQYIELHRLVSNLSEKSIWEALMAGKTKAEIKDGLPDEFHDFVDNVVSKIQTAAVEMVKQVTNEFNRYNSQLPDTDRKTFALAVKDSPFKKYLFALLDGKSVYKMALAEMKPKNDKPLVDVSEDI